MPISRRSLLLGSALQLWAQEATFFVGVDMVTLFATVRDREGFIVTNLNQNDFILADDGVPQTIRYFGRESGQPLTFGLLVDTSQSRAHVLEPERSASYTFLDQVLREGSDKAFIAHFDTRVEVLQGFTSSRKDLAAALAQMKVPVVLATKLYDAIRDCSENQMRPRGGRKAFVLLADESISAAKPPWGTRSNTHSAPTRSSIRFSLRSRSGPTGRCDPPFSRGAASAASESCGGWRPKPAEHISKLLKIIQSSESTRGLRMRCATNTVSATRLRGRELLESIARLL